MTAFVKLETIPARQILGATIHGHCAHLPGMTIGAVHLDIFAPARDDYR